MDMKITPRPLRGETEGIPSKAHGHRLLIASALADRPTRLYLGELSEDLRMTFSALTRMGMRSREEKDGSVLIFPIEEMPCTRTIDCGCSGSTLRFLFPLAAALGCNGYTYTGSARLGERPMEPLIEAMKRHGVLIRGEQFPYRVSGQLHGGIFYLPGNVSSQFLSGLLFALPLLIADSRIELTSPLESASYVDMTIAVLRQFGVKIKREGNRFEVKGRQTYASPGTVTVEKDWSNSAFWLAAGALSDEITVTGLDLASAQGDKAILSLLRQMTEKSTSAPVEGIRVKKETLYATEIDASQIPDLVPVLAVLGCAAKGTTTIHNGARLRLKESDRLKALAENLKTLGADIEETADGLVIRGGKQLHGGEVDSFDDHRIVMAMALASVLCEKDVVIKNAGAVAKSYPAFFDDFKKLGGQCDVL